MKCFLLALVVFGMVFSSVSAYAEGDEQLPEITEEFIAESENQREPEVPVIDEEPLSEQQNDSEESIETEEASSEEVPDQEESHAAEEIPSETQRDNEESGTDEENSSEEQPNAEEAVTEKNPAAEKEAGPEEPDPDEKISSEETEDLEEPVREEEIPDGEAEESGPMRLLSAAAGAQNTKPFKTREATAILDITDEASQYADPRQVTLYQTSEGMDILPVSGAYAKALVSDITTHTDSMGFYNGSAFEELAESCLYTFTASGNNWQIQSSADGTAVFLNPGGGSPGYPNTTASAVCMVADQKDGMCIRSGNHYLWYFTSGVDRSGNRCYFDRATVNTTDDTIMHLYRKAADTDSDEKKDESRIAGYIPLGSAAEIESGSQYLIAVHTTDGAIHILRPSVSRNEKPQHVLDLEGSIEVQRASVTVVPTAVGTEDITVADTIYHVLVLDSTPHKNPRETETVDVYVMPGETAAVHDETQPFTMHDSDDIAEITLTGTGTEKTEALARLSATGDDASFLGQKVFVSDLLYTFKRTSASGNGFYITSKLPDGTPVSLIPANDPGFPNKEGTYTITMSQGSTAGTFRFYNRYYLDFSPSDHLFNRTSASVQNPIHIYAADESSTGPIPGYRQLNSYAELKDGQYLIAAEEPDGSLYLLHPSLSGTKRDNVAKLTNETAQYEIGTTDGEVTGIIGGETSFTAGSTVYEIHVPVEVTMDNYESSFFRSERNPVIAGETNYLTSLHLSPLMTYTPKFDGTLLHVQSGDESVITVSNKGAVTAKENGSTFLSATVKRTDGSVCSYALPVFVEGETYTPSQCRIINYYISQNRNTIASLITPKPDGNGNLAGTELILSYGEAIKYYVPSSDPYGAMLVGRPIDEDYVLTELGSSNSSKNYDKFSESDNIVNCSAYRGQGGTNFGNLYGINTGARNPDDALARYLTALRESGAEGIMYFTRPIGNKGSVDSDLRFNAEVKQINVSTAPAYMKHENVWQNYDDDTDTLHTGDTIVFAITLEKPKYAVPVDISQAISFYRNVSHGPILTEHLENAHFIFNTNGDRTITLDDLEQKNYIEQDSVYLTQESKDELVPLEAQTLTFYVLYETTREDEGTRIRQEVDLDYEFYSKYAHGTISNNADALTVVVVPAVKSYLPDTGSRIIIPYHLTGIVLILAGLFLSRLRK